MQEDTTYTAWAGVTLVSSGSREKLLEDLKSRFDEDQGALILAFEDQTGTQVDFDLRGTLSEVLSRSSPDRTRLSPGRPKLGVIAREVTLLPRHWDWLEQQPNGASAAIRRLVDRARTQEPGEQQARQAREAAGRFLSSMAGNLPNYEDATRALYARNAELFDELTRAWPQDIRLHVQRLVRQAF